MNELLDQLQRTFAGTYQMEKELGGGGMSRVFLATESALKRRVVIKVLSPELVSPVMTARFVREFEVTALLQHPHILPVLAAGERDGLLFFITPFIEGESLRHRLEREGPLPVRDAVRTLSELARALAYAHARGVVHRDIKPENILLSNGLAVLADFGIAGALAAPGGASPAPGGTRLTALGTSIGTAGYMSPEQVAGDPNLDGRSDIYSLAVVGYEMLTGAPPFVRPTSIATMTAHLTEPPPPIESVRAETPPALAVAIARALAKDPAERFQSAEEFGDALGISFTGERTGERAVTAASAAPHPSSARRWWPLVAAVLLLIAGVAAWMGTRGGGGATLDENLVAVAPFEVLSPSLGVWREGMVDILSANLDGAGPLRTVPPTVVVRRWTGRPDKVSAKALGLETGARLAVFGTIVGAGSDSVRLTANVLDVAEDRVLGEIVLRDNEERIDRLADSLTVRVLRELNQTRAIASVRQVSLGSSSLPALKAFLQGEQHYRRSDWDSAAVYYRRAIEADSMFAPALRRLSNAMAWNLGDGGNSVTDAYRYALLAGQRNRGLAERESLLVAADSLSAALQFRGSQRMDVYAIARRLVATLEDGTRRWPNDPEIWHKLADTRFHYVYLLPNATYASARDAFDKSIALDSAFAPSYIHMPDLALRAQDPEAARRYVRTYLSVNRVDAPAARSMRVVGFLLDPSERGRRSVDSALATGDFQSLGGATSGLTFWMDSAETAIRLVRLADSAVAGRPDIPPQVKRQVRSSLPGLLATRGHLREAARLADSTAWQLLPELALLDAVAPERMDSLVASVTMGPPSGYWRIPLFYRWWSDRGDTVRLLRALRATEQMVARSAGPSGGNELEALRAHLALARRDTAEAIRHFASLPDTVCSTNWCYPDRLAKAQILSARRMDSQAAALLAQEYPQPGPGLVLWNLERGRVFERVGRREEAVDAYALVSAAWQRADPELQPAVREAREGLRRLSPEKGT